MILASTILTSGCATIVSDSSYPVTIKSIPAGASFKVTNSSGLVIHSGTTPSTVTLKSGAGYFKSASYILSFEKDGYIGNSFELESTMDGWYIGNLVFGGLIGFLIVDPATGAMWKLPNNHSTSLDSKLPTDGSSHELTVISLNDATQEMKDNMIEVK